MDKVIFWFMLLSLWIMYSHFYRQYRVDVLRQRVLKERDILFLKASKGDVPFDSKAYEMVRDTLNGMIRYSHKLSLTSFLAAIFLRKKIGVDIGKKYHEELNEALDELTMQQKKIVLSALEIVHIGVVVHLIKISPLLLPLHLYLEFRYALFKIKKADMYQEKIMPFKGKAARERLHVIDAQALASKAVC